MNDRFPHLLAFKSQNLQNLKQRPISKAPISMSSNPTQPIVTANNFGPAVNVTTWFLGSTAVLFVIARLTTKVALAQRIRIDDGLLITALVRLKGKR